MFETTEERLHASILQVQEACRNHQNLHLSQVFTRDPFGLPGLLSTFVVCDDDLALELKERLDATVRSFFDENGMISDGTRPLM